MTLDRRALLRTGLTLTAATAATLALGSPAQADPPVRAIPTDPRLTHRLRLPNQTRTALAVGRPAAEAERPRLQKALGSTDLQPTGLYLPPGTAVEVRLASGPAPTLVVGAPATHPDAAYSTPRTYALTSGTTTVTDPGGGMLYLKLAGAGELAVVHFGLSTVLAPYFLLGQTAESDFQSQLDTRTESPLVELVSPYAVVTVTRESLLRFRSEDHARLMETFEAIIASHATTSGMTATGALHGRGPVPFHLVESPRMPTGAGAYATHGFTAYPAGYMDRLISVEGLHDRGWGVWHELGHQHQQFPYKPGATTEVTCNVYALAIQRRFGLPSNLTVQDTAGLDLYDQAFAKFGTPGLDFLAAFGIMQKLVQYQQLTLAYGEDFWGRVHRLVREEKPDGGAYDDNALRFHHLMTYTSRAAGHDLRDFYRTWGMTVDPRTDTALDALALPAPTVAPATLREPRRTS
ncbi:M60 family metallopeptidase [Phytomonospora sp. NPDC050363]|uniref:M60 family metallopeptidase n=1 Tax=Phytomonospora sp. NPDC050363 TaxID=3155642 RepID=UPI0033F9C83A